VDAGRILEGLNPEQLRAVEAVRGPVCILAGAGSGKTTTITRRIAHQVAAGAFPAGQVLAVTFTDKAAGEMRSRLESLGVRGVRASTFHSAALAQLTHFRGGPPGRILASKALPLRRIGNTLPGAFRFRPAADLATEVEWAKNRRIPPSRYLASLGDHEPPIPPDLMSRVYRDYERRKEEAGFVDFEDLLELAVRLYDEDEDALVQLRDRYRAFTVDEYQDVNLLQQALLERWLGERDDVCAVGDDYQSIYAFTGATPVHLLELPRRYPHATVVRLERNYRSTPEVLELANRLVPKLGGAEKVLRAVQASGLPPEVRGYAAAEDETAFLVERVRALHAEGVPLEEMAVLYRTNARSADFEEAFHAARIPFQGAALLARDGARQLLKGLRRSPPGAVAETVAAVAREQGLAIPPPDGLGERELTRQNDLARLVRLAEEFDDGERGLAEFVAYLHERFGEGGAGGVHLLTYHRAKGLEFEAVFLPRLAEKELPSKLARTQAALAEERRLFYVGMTRAKRHLAVTWNGKPSRFLAELGVTGPAPAAAAMPGRSGARAPEPDGPIYRALKGWRLERAKADDLPAYVVFHNTTLEEIARRTPRSLAELAAVPGVGPAKLERYGEDVLAALAATATAS
jgi:DNA helicase II / ATP-dependent DNA helicase PcrA